MNEETRMPEPTEQWKPSKSELLRNNNINIEFLSIGCVVRVGCTSIPFQFVSDAIDAIKEYTKNPYEEKQKWEKLIESRQ